MKISTKEPPPTTNLCFGYSSGEMEIGRLGYLDIRHYTTTSWPDWYSKFRSCVKYEFPKKSNRQKVSLLLHKMGKDCYEIYKSLDVPENVDFDELVHSFDRYFQPLYARFVFFTRKQKAEESFDNFANALTILSFPCLFGLTQGVMVRDIFVTNLNHKYDHIRQKLCKERDPTLTETIIFVKSFVGSQSSFKLRPPSLNGAHEDLSDGIESLSLCRQSPVSVVKADGDSKNRSRTSSRNVCEMIRSTGLASRLNRYKPSDSNEGGTVSNTSTSTTQSRKHDFDDSAETSSLASVSTDQTSNWFEDVNDESISGAQVDGSFDSSGTLYHMLTNTTVTSNLVENQSEPSVPQLDHSPKGCVALSHASVRGRHSAEVRTSTPLSSDYPETRAKNILKDVTYPSDEELKISSAVKSDPRGEELEVKLAEKTASPGNGSRNLPVAVNPQINPPLPLNEYSDVTVVYIAEDTNVVYVSPFDKCELISGILKELLYLTEKNLLDSVDRLVINEVYAAPWEGLWYRAKLVSFDAKMKPSTAHVHFIDYGNDDEVDFKLLKSLPKSLKVLEPLSFPVIPPKLAPAFRPGSQLKIKLLSHNERNEWRIAIDATDFRE